MPMSSRLERSRCRRQRSLCHPSRTWWSRRSISRLVSIDRTRAVCAESTAPSTIRSRGTIDTGIHHHGYLNRRAREKRYASAHMTLVMRVRGRSTSHVHRTPHATSTYSPRVHVGLCARGVGGRVEPIFPFPPFDVL